MEMKELVDYAYQFLSYFRNSLDIFVKWTVNTVGQFIGIIYVIFFEFLILGFRHLNHMIDEKTSVNIVFYIIVILMLYYILPAPFKILYSISNIMTAGLLEIVSTISPLS